MKRNKNHIRWGLTAFLVVLASLISYYIIFHIDNFKGILSKIIVILMPVIDGMVIAYLLTPLLNHFERKLVKPFFNIFPFKIVIWNCSEVRKFDKILNECVFHILYAHNLNNESICCNYSVSRSIYCRDRKKMIQ